VVEKVINPIAKSTRDPIRLDLKKGLFALAARDRMRKGCLSGPWMTTITHAGEGYLTGELAGAKDSGQCWGSIRRPKDFASAWNGKKSQTLQQALLTGGIPVPIVHRTSPIDEFLHLLSGLTGGPTEPKLADEIIAAVGNAPWYRSGGSDFV
jgi:hypothetical protein